MIVTSPCFTEAMHLLFRAGRYRLQAELWRAHAAGVVVLHDPAPGEYDRMAELMADYQDTPMNLADASVVAAAESLHTKVVFTIDPHFCAYRMKNGAAFEVVPIPSS